MAAEASQPFFQLQTVYLKDMSLEQPHSPAIFLEKEMPELEIALHLGSERLGETTFESTVTVTVTAKIGEKTAYLVEGKQAGIFEIRGFPEETMDQVLSIPCPTIIYPYLRANIADMIQRAGFPPLHLAEINFEAYYQDRLQQQKAQKEQATAPANTTTEPEVKN